MNIALQKAEEPGDLPTTTFDAYDHDEKVGFAQLRHRAGGNPSLPENMKSHVYYEVDKSYEGKGYGTAILGAIKEEAQKIGISELFVTAFESNQASNKIIQKNGGVYLWDYHYPDGRRMLKYKITL